MIAMAESLKKDGLWLKPRTMLGIAREIGVPVEIFAVAVIFAANCSFASPIGYQTNLLVMVPGRYRFMDFVKAGLPLLFIVWLVFSMFAPWYYGL